VGIPFLLFSLALSSFLAFFSAIALSFPWWSARPGVLAGRGGRAGGSNYYIVLNSWALSLTPEWLLKRL